MISDVRSVSLIGTEKDCQNTHPAADIWTLGLSSRNNVYCTFKGSGISGSSAKSSSGGREFLGRFCSGFYGTYRLDSDLVSSMYLWKYAPKIWQPAEMDKDKLWKTKTRFAAAFISHCPTESSREVLIDELKRFMSVDVYGSCGNFTCDRSEHEKCVEIVRTNKFYLAFKNSVCKDFVTEKIHFALNNGVIPVVYGGANYCAVFPPNSFSDVMDFAEPEEAAAAVVRIGNNSEEYWSYFQWRFDPFWSELPLGRRNNTSWWKLCTMLNKPTLQPQTYDQTRWWYTAGSCNKPDIRKTNGQKRWLGHR